MITNTYEFWFQNFVSTGSFSERSDLTTVIRSQNDRKSFDPVRSTRSKDDSTVFLLILSGDLVKFKQKVVTFTRDLYSVDDVDYLFLCR